MAYTPEQQVIVNKGMAIVKAQLGLTNVIPSNWTYEQRSAYNKSLATWLLQNASNTLSKDQVGVANAIASKQYTPLEDDSFDWGMFFEEAGTQLASINNTLNPLSADNREGVATTVKWLVIAGVVVVGAIYLSPYLAPKIKEAIKSVK